MPKTSNKLFRALLVVAGSILLAFGVIGIFLPILPTTPFLLLAAACYAKSSQRFYDWLISIKYVGRHIENYREKKGMPLKAKIVAISCAWISITFSAFFFVSFVFGRVMLFFIAIVVSFHILSLRTLQPIKETVTEVTSD